MKTVTIKGRRFRLTLPESEILQAVDRIAGRMSEELADKNPLFLAILNGSFVFAADLLRRIDVAGQVSFIRLSSYSGTDSSGDVLKVIGLTEQVNGRNVVVIEDMIDSGLTMNRLTAHLSALGAADLKVAVLFMKPEALRYDVKADYVALSIPNDFVVGYGLDYDGYGRNLRDIYTLMP